MVVSHSRGFVFAHVPKTGGTSVAAALGPFADGGLESKDTGHETLDAFLTRAPQMDRLFKFAFVRNPWERAVSFYFHARQRLARTLPQMQAVAAFEDMLRLMDQGTAWLTDLLSLLPQHSFLRAAGNGRLLTDFIGRFERLEQDFAHACARIGIAAALPLTNASRREPYGAYYSDWGKGFIASHYREDIAQFRYSFEA